MICDKCHQREATVRLTFMFGEKLQKKDLCTVCAPTEELMKQAGEGSFESTRELKCDYCGAPAVCAWGTSMMSSADGTKSEESHCWCERCQDDLKEFKSRPENRLPRFSDDFDFSDPKAMEPVERLMHEIRAREQAFMRQKLAERKGPDHAV